MSAQHTEILSNILVPIAGKSDAEQTGTGLKQYDLQSVTALYVVERRPGPEVTPLSASKDTAEDAFNLFRQRIPDADSRLVDDTNTTEAILQVAEDIDATAIVFATRDSGGVFPRLLSNTLSEQLINRADRPVLALPTPE